MLKRWNFLKTGFYERITHAYEAAAKRLAAIQTSHRGDLRLVPDEPVIDYPRSSSYNSYGLDEWGKSFNVRQLLALTTFARLVKEAHAEMIKGDFDPQYARAVATYLGLAVDRQATRTSVGSFWDAGGETVQQLFARQSLAIVWDFVESTPLQMASGGFSTNIKTLTDAVVQQTIATPALVLARDARHGSNARHGFIVTDPPYYDSVNYAVLSDFFYVWLKRSIGFLYPDLLALPLTPKREQTVMNIYANGRAGGRNRREAARQQYVDSMAEAFLAMAQSLEADGLTGVVFAHTNPDAWSTLIEGLLGACLAPDASWPIDTETPAGLKAVGKATLKTSVWMVCRKREGTAGDAFLSDVMAEMRPVIRERLLYFWSQGIRGADFFISAIGPALSVFGRHARVLRPDGSVVSVREFLEIVRRESTAVALEQVLHGADLGAVDPVTQQYVTWVWSYSRAPLDTGEAIALCLATGASYDEVTRPQSIASEAREKSKKVVKLRTIRERAMDDDDLGSGAPARPVPLVDQLQHAAWLWSQNLTDRLSLYRGELGETRWTALRTLGQAVAECLPDGDEDRRIILGLLGSSVMATPAPERPAAQPAMLPGFDADEG